jgi:glycosyltransferase involved in cell wall biosynthesis
VPHRPSPPPYRLILFGYIDWNRRLNEVLKALALFPERGRLHLDVYGWLFNTEDAGARVRALGLDGLVTLHGFVPTMQLDAALASAHLAINLRSPTMGEASFSQLQIWAHGLPSLVSPAGWYATLPGETVAFVRPEYEQADLHAHWQALLANPERFVRMGEAGRRHLEAHHTPAAYAHAIIDLAAEAQRCRADAAARQLADRAAIEMSLWLAPAASPDVFRQAATSIALLANGGHDVTTGWSAGPASSVWICPGGA